MTEFKSAIKLGEKYKDPRTGIEGHVTTLVFHSTGCTEAEIEYMSGIANMERKKELFAEARLVPAEDNPDSGKAEAPEYTYESDIVLDEFYISNNDDGIGGRAAWIEFDEHIATRVALQVPRKDLAGNPDPKYMLVDEYRVTLKGSGKPVAKQPGQKGPASQWVNR